MIEKKIEEINSLKSQISAFKIDTDWDDAFLEKVKIDFTYNSNKIEGVTLTYGQTLKLLKDFVTPQNAAPGELLDLINHQKVLDNVFKNYASENFSVENIKALHKELMKNLAQWTDDSLYVTRPSADRIRLYQRTSDPKAFDGLKRRAGI